MLEAALVSPGSSRQPGSWRNSLSLETRAKGSGLRDREKRREGGRSAGEERAGA